MLRATQVSTTIAANRLEVVYDTAWNWVLYDCQKSESHKRIVHLVKLNFNLYSIDAKCKYTKHNVSMLYMLYSDHFVLFNICTSFAKCLDMT